MHFDPGTLTPDRLYKLLTATIIPRPIAWVTTLYADGKVGAAPFSFFNLLSELPPVVGFGSAPRINGELKDTAANIEARREFVVNLVDETQLQAMDASAGDYLPGESETDALGVAVQAGTAIATPRILGCPASLECRLRETVVLSRSARIFLGDVVGIHLREDLLADQDRMHIDLDAYRPMGRLFGRKYVKIADGVVELDGPDGH
jgi:flavin reductase (DIM6/NTAB) family NADH-FMN oxidoreductase RutF